MAHGWAFPDADEFMIHELAPSGTYQLANLEAALRRVTNHACAIDGGAHIGTWSKVMSGLFTRVIAVEPCRDTYACLQFNLEQAGCAKVQCLQVALGAKAGTATVAIDAANKARKNTGARHMRAGGTEVPVQTIDSWDLPSLGLLKLDVEGSEYAALVGARQTLTRCRPIVLFEDKGLWTRHYGLHKDIVRNLLTELGYQELEQVGCDRIWGPR